MGIQFQSDNPAITYPYGAVQSLKPQIAWVSVPHEGYQAAVEALGEPAHSWDSGEVAGSYFHMTCGPLLPGRTYRVRVRIKSTSGWSDWSAPQEFSTPTSPTVRFTFPADVTAVNDTRPTLRWDVSSARPIWVQTIRIDSRRRVNLAGDYRSYRTPRLETGLHTATVRTVEEGGASDEATIRFWVDAPAAHTGTVYVLDLSFLKAYKLEDPAQRRLFYDTCHFLSTLQGHVNQKGPRLFYTYFASNQFWLDQMMDPDNGWLRQAKIETIPDLDALISLFRGDFAGVVEYDPDVWATSNVASTVAGAEGLVAIRKDTSPGSLYHSLVLSGPKLPVARSLVGMFTGSGMIPGTDRPSTGSRKCDAYIWAKINYLDSGKCNPQRLAYWLDSYWLERAHRVEPPEHLLLNHDYTVRERGFVFDLSPWGDETPVDDPDQPLGADLDTMKEIFLSAYNACGGKIIHCAGFPPWVFKYTTYREAGRHEPVPTEWRYSQISSAYNVYMDADAAGISDMANASFLSQYPLPERLIQNPKPTPDDMRRLGYMDPSGGIAPLNFIYFYIGDYDSAAWIERRTPAIWNDPARGKTPMGWAFNPNLMDRNALAFDYFYRTKSDLDYFVAGDSGAGYINPNNLYPPRDPSGLPSGAAEWAEHCEPYYRRFDISVTGWLLNCDSGRLTPEAELLFAPFSGDGVMSHRYWMHAGNHLERNLPVARQEGDLEGDIEHMAERLHGAGAAGTAKFISFRTILKTPSIIKGIVDAARERHPETGYESLDPYTFCYLMRYWLGGSNERRATYTFDTIPRSARAGERIRAQIGVRNDGWDTWHASGPDRTVLAVSFSGREDAFIVPLPRDIAPGEGEVLSFDLAIPPPGKHKLVYQMRTGESGTTLRSSGTSLRSTSWFEDADDLPWRSELVSH